MRGAGGAKHPACGPQRPNESSPGSARWESRLAAVERWVEHGRARSRDGDRPSKCAGDKEAAIGAQDFETAAALRDQEKRLLDEQARGEKQWVAGPGGPPGLAGDVERLSAELVRLRAVLREHGIEPDAGVTEGG